MAEMVLVGRILNENQNRIDFISMKKQMEILWNPDQGLCVKQIEDQRFLFQFFAESDLKRVYNTGPWSFDNRLLIIEPLHVGDIPSQIPLYHISIWVRVYDLPVGFMSESVGILLGNFVGEYQEYDDDDAAGSVSNDANYMRIRVRVDVRSPLKRWKNITYDNGEKSSLLHFKYEQLPLFCFICGRLDHTESFCEIRHGQEIKRGWGRWLEAPPMGGNPREMEKEMQSITPEFNGGSPGQSQQSRNQTWYVEGRLDTEFIRILKEQCKNEVHKQKVATLDGVTDSINRSGLFNTELTKQQIDEIIRVLVLDNEMIEVKSNGMGEFSCIPIGTVCYKCVISKGSIGGDEPKIGAMASIPCGVCPRVSQCTPHGIISPQSCVYYNNWFEF